MKYLLGIDFGGGSAKATLIDVNGRIVCENSVEYQTYYPVNGFCEQKPAEWCDVLCKNTKSVIEKSVIDPKDILAVAIDSATHTWFGTDGDFNPLFDAVHWTDSRAKEESSYLREHFGEMIFKKTFHKPDTIWTLPQLLWMKKHCADVFGNIRHICLEKDYIRYVMPGVYCTDCIEAEGSMLYDCVENCWSSELCALAGISEKVLPPIVKPTDIIGEVTKNASVLTGLSEGTLVVCGTTDTCMEVFASGALNKGDTTVKLATAGRICVISDTPFPDRDLVNYSHIVDGLWYPGAATKAAASSLRWYRDTFGGEFSLLMEEAENICVGSEGLYYHPYINGELTPYADPMLCGSFVGIRATHTKAHFTRAVLEGVAYSLIHSQMKLNELGIKRNDYATVIGGGAKGKLWRQIVSDCLDLKLNVTLSSDSSLGSAMLAGLAVGVFASPSEAVNKCIKVIDTVLPNKETHGIYSELFKKYVAIHDALEPIYRENYR